MQTILLSCNSCGEIHVPADAVSFFRDLNSDQTRCTLFCPDCNRLIIKEIHSPELASDLIKAGCNVMPAPPLELYEQHPGPALTTDDLLDFCLLLETKTWYEQLLKTPGRHEKAA